jgi:hypothetical protein
MEMKYKTDKLFISLDDFVCMHEWCCKQYFDRDTWDFEFYNNEGDFTFNNLRDLTWFNLRWK